MKKLLLIGIVLTFLFSGLVYAESPVWSVTLLNQALMASGRNCQVAEGTFSRIQERKQKALAEIKQYLEAKLGHADTAVLNAFAEVPREYFHYNYECKQSFASLAYEQDPQPWAIGYGSALSDYLGQAYMTQLAAPKPTDNVLEIGTGSGFQIATLSRMAKEVYSIEIIKPLGESVGKIFKPIGYENVHTRIGDGFFGWPEVKGGFDVIIVTCAARFVPPALLEQMKEGGRMIIPIGQPYKRGQFLMIYTKDKDGRVHSRKDMGVYFVPMKGAIAKETPIKP
jgi:protein-L-isoaspartate(D-aspartate) O-methyltransferase